MNRLYNKLTERFGKHSPSDNKRPAGSPMPQSSINRKKPEVRLKTLITKYEKAVALGQKRGTGFINGQQAFPPLKAASNRNPTESADPEKLVDKIRKHTKNRLVSTMTLFQVAVAPQPHSANRASMVATQ